MPTEYTYDLPRGWRELPPKRAWLSQTDDAIDDQLFALGYQILAESQYPRCGVGAFRLWQQQRGPTAGPRYAIEIGQADEEGVIWIASLPALWEWLRRYGPISTVIEGADEEDNDERQPICAECLAEIEAGEEADVWECPHRAGDNDTE
jgi:hypothetical protein